MADDNNKIQKLQQEYLDLAHAIQTGVGYEHSMGSDDGTPKHLRVGVNTAMIQNGTIAQLLIDKGVFTELEYWEYLTNMMREEVRKYEQRIRRATGAKVSLK